MKAYLDHVGIAVADLAAALAFYRDALGLEVDAPEAVVSQQVRATTIPVGQASLELLEATAPTSAIARALDRRGPGLHHVTLRVDDLDAVLAQLRGRGVRLVDEAPRPGVHGSRVAFVHPSAAHGVLVELVQPAAPPATLTPVTFELGDLRVSVLHDGLFRLDGGAMFGVVPRALWESRCPPDDRNRIQLSMRPLLVEGDWGRLLVDCGAGDKWTAGQRDIFAFDRARALDHALADVGTSAEAIDLLLPTHLHFDHAGGSTRREGDTIVPRFPNARYLVRAAEWEDATHPHERNRASYLAPDFVPLREAGVVDFYDDDHEVRPGVRIVRTGGHTGQHQVVFVRGGGRTVFFPADLIPTTAHIQDPWIMGYDLFPMETLERKKAYIRQAIDEEWVVVFEHDPVVPAGIIRLRDGRRVVEPLR